MVLSPFCCHDISDETLCLTAARKDNGTTGGLVFTPCKQKLCRITSLDESINDYYIRDVSPRIKMQFFMALATGREKFALKVWLLICLRGFGWGGGIRTDCGQSYDR